MHESLPTNETGAVDRNALIREQRDLLDKKEAGEKIDEERLKSLTEQRGYFEQKDSDLEAYL